MAARIDPSDVIQEALVDAVRKLPVHLERRGRAFYPWLRQIAWERLVKLRRRHQPPRLLGLQQPASPRPHRPPRDLIDLPAELIDRAADEPQPDELGH